ncbi:MAG TPA: folate-binding protein [Rhodospirillales bacterium]|nr:folate-binding protein [Rhodospirillales bacterium]
MLGIKIRCPPAQVGYIQRMKTVKSLHLIDRQVLRVSGAEARVFLQGLVSNDMMRVSESYVIYAALLTPQGKYLHDFFISEFKNNFYLDCQATRIDDLLKRLKRFKLRSDIKLEIVEKMTVMALFGDYVHNNLPVNSIEGSAMQWLGGILFTDPRLNSIGARAILPENSLEFSDLNFDLTSSTFEEYDTLRITLGLPDGSRDLLVDKSILLEGGFEELNGVNFDKGCYVGQELTARTKHRGLVKNRLIPVKFKGDPPASGTEILQGDKRVGELRSVAGSSALALLRLEALDNTEQFIAGETTITLQKTDWVNF